MYAFVYMSIYIYIYMYILIMLITCLIYDTVRDCCQVVNACFYRLEDFLQLAGYYHGRLRFL